MARTFTGVVYQDLGELPRKLFRLLTEQLAYSSRQLHTLLVAGVHILRALEVLATQTSDPKLSSIWSQVRTQVEHGSTLSKALSLHPKVFSQVYVGMVQAGERSGRLIHCIQQLARMLEQESVLKKRLGAALVYPGFVVVNCLVLTLLLFWTVIPRFLEIFASLKIPMPLLTRALMGMTELLGSPTFWLFTAGIVYLAYSFVTQRCATLHGKAEVYRFLVRIPVWGSIFTRASLIRFCWVMDSLLNGGMTIFGATRLAAQSSGNPLLEEDAERLSEGLKMGQTLSQQFQQAPELYAPPLPQMTMVAEEASTLSSMFAKLARWYGMELEHEVELFGSLLEPFLISAVAVLLGLVVVAVMLPLYAFLGKLGPA